MLVSYSKHCRIQMCQARLFKTTILTNNVWDIATTRSLPTSTAWMREPTRSFPHLLVVVRPSGRGCCWHYRHAYQQSPETQASQEHITEKVLTPHTHWSNKKPYHWRIYWVGRQPCTPGQKQCQDPPLHRTSWSQLLEPSSGRYLPQGKRRNRQACGPSIVWCR